MLKTNDLLTIPGRLVSINMSPEEIEEEKSQKSLQLQHYYYEKNILDNQALFLEGVMEIKEFYESNNSSHEELLEQFNLLKDAFLKNVASKKWYKEISNKEKKFPAVLKKINAERLTTTVNNTIKYQLNPKIRAVQQQYNYYDRIVDGMGRTESQKCDLKQSYVIAQSLFGLASIDPNKAAIAQSTAGYLLDGNCYFHLKSTDYPLEGGIALIDCKTPLSRLNSDKSIKSGALISSNKTHPIYKKMMNKLMEEDGNYYYNLHSAHTIFLFANPEFNDFSYVEKSKIITQTLMYMYEKNQQNIEDQNYEFSRTRLTTCSIAPQPVDTKTYAAAVYATTRPIDQPSAKIRQTDKKLSPDNSPKKLDPFITSITYEAGDELLRYDSKLYNNIPAYKV